MPLPQAPSQLGDILTDYGPEAKPKSTSKKNLVRVAQLRKTQTSPSPRLLKFLNVLQKRLL